MCNNFIEIKVSIPSSYLMILSNILLKFYCWIWILLRDRVQITPSRWTHEVILPVPSNLWKLFFELTKNIFLPSVSTWFVFIPKRTQALFLNVNKNPSYICAGNSRTTLILHNTPHSYSSGAVDKFLFKT